MKIANEFTVSAPIEDAWQVLTDLEQVIPLMPGAQMTGREGDDVRGKVRVKVGPVTREFSGRVHFVEQDAATHRAVIDGKGKEARGTGNAAATVTAQLHDAGDRTRVTVDTDLKIVGKLAQFGSSMLQQVSEKLLGQFVASLEAKLAADSAPVAPVDNGEVRAVAAMPPPKQPEAEPIDLIQLAGGGALKKYGPAVFGVVLAAAVVFALGRLRLARKALRRRR